MDEEFKKEVEDVFDIISKLGQINGLSDEQQECLSELSISIMRNSHSHDSLKQYSLILKSLPSSWSPKSPPDGSHFIIKQLITLYKRISSNEGGANSVASFEFDGVEKQPSVDFVSKSPTWGPLTRLIQNWYSETDANLYGEFPKLEWSPEELLQLRPLIDAPEYGLKTEIDEQPFNKKKAAQPAAQHKQQLKKASGGRQKKLPLKRRASLSSSKKVVNNRPKKRARRKSTGYKELSHAATTSMPYEFLAGGQSSWYEWKDLNLGWVVEGSLPNSSILLPKENSVKSPPQIVTTSLPNEDTAETSSPSEECFVLITDDEDDDESISDGKSMTKPKPAATEAVALVKETGKEITSSNSEGAAVGVPMLTLSMQEPAPHDPTTVIVPLVNYKSEYDDLSSSSGREVQRPLEGESRGARVGQREEKCTYHVSGPDPTEFNSSIVGFPIPSFSFDPAALVQSANEVATAASTEVEASLFKDKSENPNPETPSYEGNGERFDAKAATVSFPLNTLQAIDGGGSSGDDFIGGRTEEGEDSDINMDDHVLRMPRSPCINA